jgi:hypothetical protein
MPCNSTCESVSLRMLSGSMNSVMVLVLVLVVLCCILLRWNRIVLTHSLTHKVFLLLLLLLVDVE